MLKAYSSESGPKCHKRHENVTLQNAEKNTQQNNTPEETPNTQWLLALKGSFANMLSTFCIKQKTKNGNTS